ncbi:MAG: extracellular solute-binding protein [Candidatus Latescibacteria bacterium]|nr:extracellular solute-binding protein [Candidatus Latescibacterota bacterium]
MPVIAPRLFLLLLLLAPSLAAATERLVVWGLSTQSEWDRGTQVLTETFEERYGVEVETFSPGSFNEQKVLSAIAGGVAPDLLPLGEFARDWVGRGVVRPLDEYLAADQARPDGIRLADYYPATLELVTFSGHVYALPDWSIGFGLYYNKDLLREAGLVDSTGQPRPPATWEEWFTCNQRLTRRDAQGNIVRVGSYPGPYLPSLYTLTRQQGGTFVDPEGRTSRLSSPQSLAALSWLVRFGDYFGGRQRLEAFKSAQGAGRDPLFTGEEAMRVEGQWYITNFARFGPDIDYDVSPTPHLEGYPQLNFQLTTTWGIPVGAHHPELAWEFLRWYLSAEAQELKARETIAFTRNRGQPFTPFTTANRRINQLVADRYVLDNPVFPEKTRRAYGKFVASLEGAEHLHPVLSPAGQLLNDELARAYEQASWHRLSPEQALATSQERVQQALDLYWGEEQFPLVEWEPLFLAGGVLALGAGLWGAGLFWRRLRPLGRQRRTEALAGVAFVLPWGVGFALLLAGPLVLSFLLSFTRYSVLRPARWVGLDNYLRLFTTDPLFWKSLGNTLFMLLGIPLGMALGLVLALLLGRALRGMAFYRTLYFLPSVVPAVASALLWVWIFHPSDGLANRLLGWFGIEGPLWLQSEDWAKPAILLHGLWGAGSGMIIWLAGLKSIPQHLYEAAAIDGAGRWHRLWHLTLPLLTPHILFNLIMGTIGTLQIFAQAVVMTKGGPLDATLFYVYYLFNNAFSYFQLGYASAMSWVLFFLILALTLLQLRLASRWVYYEGEDQL